MSLRDALEKASEGQIIPSIVAAVSERNGQISKYPAGCLHPSSLYKKCPRASFFQLRDAERNPAVFPAKTRMIWDAGHFIEDYLVKQLEIFYGDSVETQVSAVMEEYGFRGNLDVVLHLPQLRHGVEIKSSNDYWFRKVKNEGPPMGYVWQATFYYKVLELDKLSWLYYNKNTCELLEIELEYKEDVWQAILDQAYEINKAEALDIAPEMLPTCIPNGNIECEYCKACLKRREEDARKSDQKES